MLWQGVLQLGVRTMAALSAQVTACVPSLPRSSCQECSGPAGVRPRATAAFSRPAMLWHSGEQNQLPAPVIASVLPSLAYGASSELPYYMYGLNEQSQASVCECCHFVCPSCTTRKHANDQMPSLHLLLRCTQLRQRTQLHFGQHGCPGGTLGQLGEVCVGLG